MIKHVDLNRVPINGDDLELYFTKIFTTFDILKEVYSSIESKESKIIFKALKKLERTFQALRFKYLFDDAKALKIDTTDSGFPHFYELDKLLVDIKNLDILKLEAKNETFLKEDLANKLLSKQTDELGESLVLKDLAFTSYVNFLTNNGLFLPFNEGELELIDSSEGLNRYSYYWFTYDIETNMPYVYILYFDSSVEIDVETFLKAIKANGNRAPHLNIVATSIDHSMDSIHPKVLKRVKLGPFYSSKFAEDLNDNITKVFDYGDEGKKFLLFIEDEFIYSKDQVVSESIFSKDKIREIFAVHETNMDLYEKGVSDVVKKVILPYKLHQHISEFCNVNIVYSFDNGGKIHGIK